MARCMARYGLTLFTVSILVLTFIAIPGTRAEEYTCSSCVTCNTLLGAAQPGDVVKMTTDISTASGSCISAVKPTTADGVTFDCQGYSIECDTSSCVFGIQVESNKTIITGCDVRYFNYGIFMAGSHNTVNNTICANNSWAGIDILGEATNNTIINSVFTHNKGAGMDGHGIFLTGNVTDNELNNVLSSHNNKGITIQSMSNNNLIRRSTIELNAEYGIKIEESQSNTIKRCIIENNPTGLVIDNDASNSNLIFNNYFKNTVNVVASVYVSNGWNRNLLCSGSPNILGYPCLGGNYWDDYTGQDLDGDGIGDTPYLVHNIGQYDYLPLVHPPFVLEFVTPTPSDGSTIGRDWVYVNVSSNMELSSCTLERNGVNESMAHSGDLCYKNKTGIPDGDYTFRVWGISTDGNHSSTEERTVTINTEQPPPPFVMNFELPTPAGGSTLERDWILINVSGSEDFDTCTLEWNGINESGTRLGRYCYKNKTGIPDGDYTFRIWGSGLAGSSGVTGERSITVDIPDTTGPVITHTIVPKIAELGSDVTIMMNVSDDKAGVEVIWLVITLPNSTTITRYPENMTSFNYTTALTGTHNVTFFANDTEDNQAEVGDSFDVEQYIEILNFTVSLTDGAGDEVECDLTIYHTGTTDVADEYEFGDVSIDGSLEEGIYDFLFQSDYVNMEVLLREINLSENMEGSIVMDETYPEYGFLHTYAVDTNLTMSIARIRVYYEEVYVDDEDSLGVYVCDDWDMGTGDCDSSWEEITATQNSTADYFDIEVTGFSAFSIKQEPYCGDGVCGDDEDSGSCSDDCECDSGEIRPCSVAHEGVCAKGTESCVDGTWTDCPVARIETCDGDDNDCNGIVDDVLGGDSIEETQCGCYDGSPAQDEVCNGIDDDCDGDIDEDGNCCSNGDTRSCGPDEIGVCMKGTSTCIDNIWGPCEGAYYGEDEICGNELDDDCDWDTDEDCGFGFDMGMILIIVGIIILAVIVFLYFHFRKEGKELTWQELKNKWGQSQ